MLQILVFNGKYTFAHATKRLELLQMQECFKMLHTYETCCVSDETPMASWTYRDHLYLNTIRYMYKTYLWRTTRFAYDCSLYSFV